jgi:hypothetical protein
VRRLKAPHRPFTSRHLLLHLLRHHLRSVTRIPTTQGSVNSLAQGWDEGSGHLPLVLRRSRIIFTARHLTRLSGLLVIQVTARRGFVLSKTHRPQFLGPGLVCLFSFATIRFVYFCLHTAARLDPLELLAPSLKSKSHYVSRMARLFFQRWLPAESDREVQHWETHFKISSRRRWLGRIHVIVLVALCGFFFTRLSGYHAGLNVSSQLHSPPSVLSSVVVVFLELNPILGSPCILSCSYSSHISVDSRVTADYLVGAQLRLILDNNFLETIAMYIRFKILLSTLC